MTGVTDADLTAWRKLIDAATPGPWGWFGNMKYGSPYLATIGRGRQYVMRFKRKGMQDAEPLFQDQTAHRMVAARELAIYEVCPTATDEADSRLYRHDIIGFRNPDAALIADAPTIIAALLAEVTRLRTPDPQRKAI